MKLYLVFLVFSLLFLGINVALLDNLRRIWYVGFPIILLTINIDLLVLVIVFAIFFRKFIKAYLAGSRSKIRRKLSTATLLYVFIPILFLNFATSLVLIQSTKTLVSSQLKDVATKSEKLYQRLEKREDERIGLYREFFLFLLRRGEDPTMYTKGLREVKSITRDANCLEYMDASSVVMCIGGYKIVLIRDKETLSSIGYLYGVSKQLRNLVKSRDVISGIYVYFLVLITLVTLLASVWFGNLVARYISLPLERLSQRAREISKGNFSVSVSIPATNDELQDLSESFEIMKEELRSMYSKLEGEKRMLEELINVLPVGIVYISKEGRFLVNDTFINMFGVHVCKEEDLKGLQNRQNIKEDFIESADGKVFMYEDLEPIILSERFKTWQYAVKRIAHEIKNPLTPVSLNLERISKLIYAEPIDRSKIKEAIDLMLGEIERIKNIVNQFRDLSIERDTKPEELSLRQLIEDVSKLYTGLRVNVEGDKTVYADRSMLKDMFLNLFNNSLDWGAKSVRIKIDETYLDYLDDGKGIEKGKEELIFFPHHSDNPKGMGIGLAVVKHITHVHGWNIKALYDERGFYLIVEFKSS
ncbi:MAG: HAMP domain-containing protein [Aquificaceae bacterium]